MRASERATARAGFSESGPSIHVRTGGEGFPGETKRGAARPAREDGGGMKGIGSVHLSAR